MAGEFEQSAVHCNAAFGNQFLRIAARAKTGSGDDFGDSLAMQVFSCVSISP